MANQMPADMACVVAVWQYIDQGGGTDNIAAEVTEATTC